MSAPVSDHGGANAERADHYPPQGISDAVPHARRKHSPDLAYDHKAETSESYRPRDHASDVLDRVYREHHEQLLKFARARTRNRADAADIVQDAFLATKRAYPDKSAGELRSILFTTVRNLSANHMKSADARRQRDAVDLGDIGDTLACNRGVTPEKQAIDSQLLALVAEAMARMPSRQRKALYMHRYDGMTYEAIARKLRVSETTAKDDVNKALKALTIALSDPERPQR